MLQCKDCEYFQQDEKTGRVTLRCNPFSTIKEPTCLEKLQLLRLDGLLQAYQVMLRWYQQLGPMQKKMFDMMQREMDDIDDSNKWKYHDNEDDDDPDYENDDEDYSF